MNADTKTAATPTGNVAALLANLKKESLGYKLIEVASAADASAPLYLPLYPPASKMGPIGGSWGRGAKSQEEDRPLRVKWFRVST